MPGLRPVSQLAITVGLCSLCVGTFWWFAVPRAGDHYMHVLIFVPVAAAGALLCGIGLLISWRTVGWPLRILGVLMFVLAPGPLVLITSVIVSAIANFPSR